MGNVTEVMPILYIQSMYFTSKDEELNVFIPWRTFITKTSLQYIQSSHKESCCMLKKVISRLQWSRPSLTDRSSVCQEGVTSDSKTTALLQAKAQLKNISLKSLAATRTVFHLRSKQCDTWVTDMKAWPLDVSQLWLCAWKRSKKSDCFSLRSDLQQ